MRRRPPRSTRTDKLFPYPTLFRSRRSSYETILFSLDNSIARLTLDRPDRLNSFTVRMHEEVADALGKLGDARVLVITGAGRGFCAGQDLNDRAVAPGESVDLGHSVEIGRAHV